MSRTPRTTEAELDTALTAIGHFPAGTSDSVIAEVAELNHRLRAKTVRESAESDHCSIRRVRTARKPARVTAVGAIIALGIIAGVPAVTTLAGFGPADESSEVTQVADLSPQWMPLPTDVTATTFAEKGAQVYIDFQVVRTSTSGSTEPVQTAGAAAQLAIESSYVRLGLCLWADEWADAETVDASARQERAATVLQGAPLWPSTAESAYRNEAEDLAADAADDDSKAVAASAARLDCTAVLEAFTS